MNTLDHNKKYLYCNMAVRDRGYHPGADSQALQEIISVLQNPFQRACDSCNGLGFVRSGQDCPACEGSGKVTDDLFR